jgi:prepilin-type N-terminal cleavage/methylation domain-containing protein
MKTSAFSLMELLVATSVIAVLSALAIPVVGSMAQKEKLTQDVSNLRQIGVALQAYENDNNGKMPTDQGGYFIVSAQSTDQTLVNYTGSSFAVWHSSFDPRSVAPGDSSPVSYSINEKVLTPEGGTPNSEGWTGAFAVSEAPLSGLIVASPSFTIQDGAASWGENVASMVLVLPDQGQGMFQTSPSIQPSFYSEIPSLFADFHVELVPIANYQCTASNSADWVHWDPMNSVAAATTPAPALAPLAAITWDSGAETEAPPNMPPRTQTAVHMEAQRNH